MFVRTTCWSVSIVDVILSCVVVLSHLSSSVSVLSTSYCVLLIWPSDHKTWKKTLLSSSCPCRSFRARWFLKVLVTALCSFASWCIMLVVLEILCCWIHWKLSRVRHRASRGTSVFRYRQRSSKISVVLRLGWISTQNRSGQSIVHLSFANVAWWRSFCVVAKYDWAHSNQFESRNQVVLWNTYVHSCEEYKDFCDRTSSVLKHAKYALFSSQLQDASDAMFETFSMTEERLQAVSLACDDDGHDAPQPNKSVNPHPRYCNIRPIQSLDMFGHEIKPGVPC